MIYEYENSIKIDAPMKLGVPALRKELSIASTEKKNQQLARQQPTITSNLRIPSCAGSHQLYLIYKNVSDTGNLINFNKNLGSSTQSHDPFLH